jgi:hypothetical protein
MRKTQYDDYAKWISFEVLAGYQIRLVFTNDLLKSATGRLGCTPGENADAFCYHVKGIGQSYIFLPLDAPEGTVVHEAWHVVFRMMHYIHVQDMDDEVVAYHLDHLIEQIYKFKRQIEQQEVTQNDRKRRPSTSQAVKRSNR